MGESVELLEPEVLYHSVANTLVRCRTTGLAGRSSVVLNAGAEVGLYDEWAALEG